MMAVTYGVGDVDSILELAARFPIFPCGPDKKPRIKGGFHAATQDPAQIRAWWRQWPDSLVGVPTGQATGLVVVDYDPDKANSATHAWIADHSEQLLGTRSHKTGREGLHYLFASKDRYQTGVDLVLGGSPRRGIDLRANGGYIIWWPIHTGQRPDAKIAPLPAGLIDERRFDRERDLAPLPKATPEDWRREKARVSDALQHLSPNGYERWIRVGMAIHAASSGSDDGFGAWHEWSAGGESYDGIEDCRYHWGSFGRHDGRGIGLGSLYALAKESGWSYARAVPESPPMELPPVEAYEDDFATAQDATGADTPDTESTPDLRVHLLDWRSLVGHNPPDRQWRIPHWMTSGPMLFAGKGGTGKSSVAQALGTALTLCKPYFAEAVEQPLNVLAWQCEDDRDEMWRRQLPILKHFDATLEDIADRFHMECRRGLENSLMVPVYGTPTWTPLLKYLREQVHDLAIDVLFLDNIGHVFGCNENARYDVTMFVNGIAGLVTDRPFTAVLMGHTARSQGSEYAGSAAWENAVRMRWWLGHNPPDQPEPEEGIADESIRYLSKRKANYAQRDLVRLSYRDGLFIPDAPAGESFTDRYNAGRYAEEARYAVTYAINKAAETGTRVVKGKNSSDSLLRWMRNLQLGTTFTDPQLLRAVDELIAEGRIAEGIVGQYPNRTKKVGLVVK